MENELDLLAGLLLEGGDDLPDRRVLLGVVPLLPPHHEVGGPGAERRQDDARRPERRRERAWSCLRQDLLDPGDRLVDRLLGGDALGGDAVDRLRPDALAVRSGRAVRSPETAVYS